MFDTYILSIITNNNNRKAQLKKSCHYQFKPQTRNRVGFGFENQFFSGSGRFSGFNIFVRAGFGLKNQLFFGKNIETCLIQVLKKI